MTDLKAPFPWFGGKSKVAQIVWQRFGDVTNYVEPFFGSGAVLLKRPSGHKRKIETINDADAYVTNFWRAIKHDPEAVAAYADDIPSENDLHARHAWLVARKDELRSQVEGDPEYYDAKIAGWWVWGICIWIGSGWCSANGPWQVVDGRLLNVGGMGVRRQRLHLGTAGMGINRKLLHLRNAGRGINRQRLHLGQQGTGVKIHSYGGREAIKEWFTALAARFRHVRIASGDWSRVCGPSVTFEHGMTGVFLDPPYDGNERASDLYTVDNHTVAHDVRAWCLENGSNPLLRIALCGYDTEHGELENHGWQVVKWNAGKGFAGQRKSGSNDNGRRERIWFSPACIGNMEGLPLFAGDDK